MRRILASAAVLLILLVAGLTSVTAPSQAAPANKGSQRNSYVLSYGPDVLAPAYQLQFADGTPQAIVDAVTAAASQASAVSGSRISTAPAPFVIDVAVTADDVCGNGCAWVGWDGVQVTSSVIRIEAWSFPQEYAPCLAVHELGHTLGLTHVTDTRQVMNATWNPATSPCGWGRGDLAGLTAAG